MNIRLVCLCERFVQFGVSSTGDEFALRDGSSLFCKEDHDVLEKSNQNSLTLLESNNNNTTIQNNNSVMISGSRKMSLSNNHFSELGSVSGNASLSLRRRDIRGYLIIKKVSAILTRMTATDSCVFRTRKTNIPFQYSGLPQKDKTNGKIKMSRTTKTSQKKCRPILCPIYTFQKSVSAAKQFMLIESNFSLKNKLYAAKFYLSLSVCFYRDRIKCRERRKLQNPTVRVEF